MCLLQFVNNIPNKSIVKCITSRSYQDHVWITFCDLLIVFICDPFRLQTHFKSDPLMIYSNDLFGIRLSFILWANRGGSRISEKGFKSV